MSDQTVALIDTEAYAAFVDGVELQNIWLRECHVENDAGAEFPAEIAVQVNIGEPTWKALDGSYIFDARYAVTFQAWDDVSDTGKAIGSIRVTFGVAYEARRSASDEMLLAFSESSLRLSTWPYLRELVSSFTSRMNWPPLALPVFKVGTELVLED